MLLDRTLSQFDAHDDAVFLVAEQGSKTDPHMHASSSSPTACLDGARASPTSLLAGLQVQQATEAEQTSTRPRRRRGAFHLDPKALEAKVSERYAVFQLPVSTKALFPKPLNARNWLSLAAMAKYIVDVSHGIVTAIIG